MDVVAEFVVFALVLLVVNWAMAAVMLFIEYQVLHIPYDPSKADDRFAGRFWLSYLIIGVVCSFWWD